MTPQRFDPVTKKTIDIAERKAQRKPHRHTTLYQIVKAKITNLLP